MVSSKFSYGENRDWVKVTCCKPAVIKRTIKNLSSFYFALSASELPDPALLIGLDKFDIVCFDNIEQIAGDPVWEQAFFNFFNQHRSLSHKLIVSAACAPGKLDIRLTDLKTRLNWGLSLKIKTVSG